MVVARGYPDSVGSGGIRVTPDSRPRRAALQDFTAIKKSLGALRLAQNHLRLHIVTSVLPHGVKQRGENGGADTGYVQ